MEWADDGYALLIAIKGRITVSMTKDILEPVETELAFDLLVDRAGITVTIRGELDVQSSPQLRDQLLQVIRRYGAQLALDLGGVTFMDCAGINVLLATGRRAQLEGGWIRVTRASPWVRRIITLTGLQRVFALPEATISRTA